MTEPPNVPAEASAPSPRERLREQWLRHAAAAFDLLFADEAQADLISLDQREQRVIELRDDLGLWLLRQHLQADPDASAPATAGCPRCGKDAQPRPVADGRAPRRALTTRAGPLTVQRPAFWCPTCRVVFFPPGRQAGPGH